MIIDRSAEAAQYLRARHHIPSELLPNIAGVEALAREATR
jgi:hypothetical protein